MLLRDDALHRLHTSSASDAAPAADGAPRLRSRA